MRALQRQLGSIFSQSFASATGGSPTSLSELGFHRELTGFVTFNPAELETALNNSEADVESLVASFASTLEETLKGFEGSRGILTHRVDQLGAELQRISVQREDLNRRMAGIEQRLRARFSALDSLVTQLQTTSTFLTQQIAGLNAITNFRSKS